MEAYKVVYHDPKHLSDQEAIVFAISASSAIRKVVKKFKIPERQIKLCELIGRRIAL